MTALSSRYKIHANLITKWKKRAQEGLVEVFSERQIPYHWIDIEEHAEGERIFVSDDHLSLTKNRNFQDDLLHILLDRPPSWER